MKLEFYMPMRPPRTTAQQQRIGNKKIYKGASVSDAQRKLTAHLYAYAPAKPLDGPIRMTTIWQWNSKGHDGEWKTTKPDTDNLQKLLKDCMTRLGYWHDDAQVCDEHIAKRWTAQGDCPGIFVRVETLDGGTGGE
jgi:Holliday junction resolvase RusA-like endonuclease